MSIRLLHFNDETEVSDLFRVSITNTIKILRF